MYELKDLTQLNWSLTRQGGASYGCYKKATCIERGVKYYYKCSSFYKGQGCFGGESIIEVIISRLLRKLGFSVVDCTLVYGLVPIDGVVYKTYVCKSRNFFDTKHYTSRISLEELHALSGYTNVLQLISSLGIIRSVEEMFIEDFLTIQRDRHGANIELLERKQGNYVMSPLFDNGLGLLAPYSINCGADYRNFDVMANLPVNNYIGYRDLYRNLDFIRASINVNKLSKSDRRVIFYGLGSILPRDYMDKTWDIIWWRYNYLKSRGLIHEV